MTTHPVFSMMLIRTAGLPLAQLKTLSANWQTAEERILVGRKQLTDHTISLQHSWDGALASIADAPLRTAVYNARKLFFQRQKLPAPSLLETLNAHHDIPEINGLLQALNGYTQAQAVLDKALHEYRLQVETWLSTGFQSLQQLASNENFQRALLFSSHALLSQLTRFCQTPVEQFAKKERQTALAVLQYATRMAAKTSPLSRFTTVAVKKVDTLTQTQEQEAFSKTVVTPNVAVLEAMYGILLSEPAFYRSLSLTLNPCVVSVNPEKYTWLYYNGEEESFQEAQASLMLDFVVQVMLDKDRGENYVKLLETLSSQIEATSPVLEKYIFNLVDLGFLEWVLPENGLTPFWCGNLYQYLGFLPGEPLIVDTAALVQWLRTTARTLPYLPAEAASKAQKEAWEQVQHYFQTYGDGAIPIPVEQLFFEDVEQEVSCALPPAELEILLNQLAECWVARPQKPLPEKRAQLKAFLDQCCPQDQSIGFLPFCRRYLSERPQEDTAPPGSPNATLQHPTSVQNNDGGGVRVGGLLQIYREKGHWYAVVNSLFPGGGKLFARWLHLFPPGIHDALREWNTTADTPSPGREEKACTRQVSFPWQSWSNANFQPALYNYQLAVPGGRNHSKSAGVICLGNLSIRNSTRGPELTDVVSGRTVILNDLGLEAPESRPPVIQLLWLAGTPYISIDALLPPGLWKPLYDDNIRYRARYVYRRLVLARAAWAIEPVVWQSWLYPATDLVDFFTHIRQALPAMGVPPLFFACFAGDKPQYFDLNSPVLVLLFQKNLEKGNGTLLITEMLPLPDQAVVESTGMRAAEFVVEMNLG